MELCFIICRYRKWGMRYSHLCRYLQETVYLLEWTSVVAFYIR